MSGPNALPTETPESAANRPYVDIPKMGLGQQMAQQAAEKRAEMEREGPGYNKIHNPLLHGLARVADVAGSILAPGLATAIPGTTMHHNWLVNQQLGREALGTKEAQEEAQTAEAEARAHPKPQIVQTDEGLMRVPVEEGAATPVTTASGESLGKPNTKESLDQITADRAALADKYGLTGDMKNHYVLTGQMPAGMEKPNLQETVQSRMALANEYGLQGKEKTHYVLTGQIPQKFEFPPTGPAEKGVLMSVPDGKGGFTLQRILPGQPVPSGSSTPTQIGAEEAKKGTLTADEQRRHDLAENLSENLNQIEDIAKRRPELFGAVHGRETIIRNWMGSKDPDIAALGAIREMVGQAMLGAHSMRAAQHIEKAGDAILNSYKTPADALLNGSIPAARNSIATFLQEKQQQQANPKPTSQTGAPKGNSGITIDRDAQGNIIGVH